MYLFIYMQVTHLWTLSFADRARESRPQRSGHSNVRASWGSWGWCWTSSEFVMSISKLVW